jgi:hypothetical protein
MKLVDKTSRPNHPRWLVVDDSGNEIGTVAMTRLGRQGREFYDARAADGCDLGAHRQRADAAAEVLADAVAGCPRSPRNARERYRPLYDGPEPAPKTLPDEASRR